MLDRHGAVPLRRFDTDRQYRPLDIPESFGPRTTTRRGELAHTICPPGARTFRSANHWAVVMLAPSPGLVAALGSDKPQTCDAPLGSLVLSPAGLDCSAKWSVTCENILVAITPESLLELAAHEADIGHVDLRPPPVGTVDLHALQLAEMMRAELTREDTANELYADSLITAFGIHLLRNYTGAPAKPLRPKGGLPVFAARRLQEYLDEHFTRKVTVAELAAVCSLSPGHFIQSFTKTFGEPPHRYLVNRRLAFAEKLLFETEMTIAEVAYLSGFSSQSHLTATMRKYKRITPAQLRMKR